MARLAEKFCFRFLHGKPERRLLALIGETGTGKTHVARAIARWASACGSGLAGMGHFKGRFPTVGFFRWSGYASDKRTDEGTFSRFIEEVEKLSLAVIDDIGTETDEFRSGSPTRRLTELLNAREKKFTVLTTNIALDKWAERWDERVQDRLLRNSEIVTMNCQSFATI